MKLKDLFLVPLILMAGGWALSIVGTARAGHCATAASYSYGYSASYYPSYSYYPTQTYSYYTPTYTYYTPKYEVKEVVVPKAVKAYVSPDYFASTSDYYRDKVLLDAIAGKNTDAAALKQELAELKAQIQRQGAAPQQYMPPQPYVAPQTPQGSPWPAVYQGYAPQQQYGYGPGAPGQAPPNGGTPCDWRAQQAYQAGLQAGAQGGGYSGPPANPPSAPPAQSGLQGGGTYTPLPPRQPGASLGTQNGTPPEGRRGNEGGVQPPKQGGREEAPTFPQEQPSEAGGSGRGQAPKGTDIPPPEGEAKGPVYHGPVPDGLSAVVQSSCVRCHGPTHEDDGHGLDLRDLQAVPVEDRMESYTQVVSGDMPKKAHQLTKEQQALFRSWYRAAVKHQRQTVGGDRQRHAEVAAR